MSISLLSSSSPPLLLLFAYVRALEVPLAPIAEDGQAAGAMPVVPAKQAAQRAAVLPKPSLSLQDQRNQRVCFFLVPLSSPHLPVPASFLGHHAPLPSLISLSTTPPCTLTGTTPISHRHCLPRNLCAPLSHPPFPPLTSPSPEPTHSPSRQPLAPDLKTTRFPDTSRCNWRRTRPSTRPSGSGVFQA